MSSLYADQMYVGTWLRLYIVYFLLKIYSNHNMPCTETTHQRSHILPSAMSGILWSLPKTGLHYLVFLLQNSYQNLSFEMQMLKWEVVHFPLLTENTLHPYIHHWLIYIDSIEWRCWKVLWKQYDLKLTKNLELLVLVCCDISSSIHSVTLFIASMMLFRHNMSGLWMKAAKFIRDKETRVREEEQLIGGEEFVVWRWLQVSRIAFSSL